MRCFILEDEIHFPPRNIIKDVFKRHDLTIAKSFQEAKRLYAPPYELLLLDHDMEGRFEQSLHPNTGWRFCEWMVNQKCKPTQVILHSQNPQGRTNMRTLLSQFGWDKIEEIPFSEMYVTVLRGRYENKGIGDLP